MVRDCLIREGKLEKKHVQRIIREALAVFGNIFTFLMYKYS